MSKPNTRQPNPKPGQRKLAQPSAVRPRTTPAAPPVFRPQPAPKLLQAKAATPAPRPAGTRPAPAAPPVYRPQPPPKVLQAKGAVPARPGPASAAVRKPPVAPPVYNPQPTPKVLQKKQAAGQQPRPGPDSKRVTAPGAAGVARGANGPATFVQRPAAGSVAAARPATQAGRVLQPMMRAGAGLPAARPGAPPARLQVIQRGTILNLPGISDAVELAAQAKNVEDELRYAVAQRVSPQIIEPIFLRESKAQLARLPTQESPGGRWDELKKVSDTLGQAGYRKWVGLVGMAVREIHGFQMLLTDRQVERTHAQATEVMSRATPPPRLAGKPYDEIVTILKRLGYRQQESFLDVRGGATTPYGQDVWTHDNQMVIRIKVGGRCINGKFARPPHVVKEITGTAHEYGVGDIICKLTDDNILIPAGTVYSARDMQTWFAEKTGRALDANAWRNPLGSGDAEFGELHQMWAEGAHTAIGGGLSVPQGDLDRRQENFLGFCQRANKAVNEFEDQIEKVVDLVHRRGQDAAVTKAVSDLSAAEKKKAYRALDETMQVIPGRNPKQFHSKLDKVRTALYNWKSAIERFLGADPPVKPKVKPFFVRLFEDAKNLYLDTWDSDPWDKFANPFKK